MGTVVVIALNIGSSNDDCRVEGVRLFSFMLSVRWREIWEAGAPLVFRSLTGGVVGQDNYCGVGGPLRGSMGLKTLAIDLDPQANLSQVLMGENQYKSFLERTFCVYC